MEGLYELTHTNPRKAIPRLMKLKEKYPNIPELYNWLAVSQAKTGDIPAYEATTKENYEKNPDYLFAKLNYADVCFNQGKLDEIPVIFDQKFELSFLYPERDIFHISEVVGFFGVMGIYHSETGNMDAAKVCYDLLNQIAPEHDTTRLGVKSTFDSC
jgi:lipoprotein NlpI